MREQFRMGLSFDDVLIQPEYTEIESRNDVNTQVTVAGIHLDVPLISSPMDTVTEAKMAIEIGKLGGMGILHRFATDEERLKMIQEVIDFGNIPVVYAVGASVQEIAFMRKVEETFSHNKISAVCIDLANGWSVTMKKMILHIKEKYPDLNIIAGNIANAGGYEFLADLGVQAVRVGIGGGCFTASTKVLMADGTYKNINKISPGDFVINKDGKAVEVKALINNGYKKVLKVRTTNWAEPFYVTHNHNYWLSDLRDIKNISKVSKRKVIERENKNKNSRLKWLPISNATKDTVLLSPNNINFQKLNSSFEEDLKNYTKSEHYLNNIKIKSNYNIGYIFGMMLGDGHAFLNNNGKSEIGRINCYLNKGEDKIAKKFTSLLKKEFKVDSKIEYTDNMILISAYSKPLAHFFFQFGKKDKKSLPSKYLVNNKPYIKGLLDGLIDSDGHIEANGRVSFYNTSEELKELFEICCFILNKTFQSSIREPRAGNLKNCNIENCKSAYQVRIHTSNRKSKNYWYSIILSAEETEILQETWDIEVDCPTHSFIANNSIVHNSICMTRIQTGIGVPTLQSVLDCHKMRESRHHLGLSTPEIIADGGIKYPQDLCKSLIGGASAVICGGIFAGTKEAPGEVIKITDKDLRKRYRGMASAEVQEEKRGGLKEGTVAEGVSTLIPYEGSLRRVVTEFTGGLKSSMSYVNARTTDTYIGTPHRLIRISENGVKESHAYGTRRR